MKKIMHIGMSFVLAATMMSGSLAVVHAEEEPEISGTLSLCAIYDTEELWNQIAERFNEQYPDVEFDFNFFDDYTALNTNALAAHQAGDDFDLITVNHVDTLSFIKGGVLYDMTDYLAEHNIDVDSIIMGQLADMGKLGDRTYTIPIDTDTRIMLVNTDLFERNGVEIPTTMDEMLEAGKAILEAGNGDYIFTDEMCTNGDYFSTYEAGIFLQCCGGKLYDVDENGKATAMVDTPEMREYLNFITELLPLMPADCVTNNDARSAMAEGNIGMYTFGPWEYNLMDMDNLGFNYTLTRVPAGPAGSVSTSGGYQIGVGAGSDNIDAAIAFVNFLINDAESMSLIGASGLPTVENAYDEGQFASEKYDMFKEQLTSSNLPQVPVANLGEVVACFTGYWNDLCIGNITVDEMIEGAQADVQQLLDENN